eukprot:TRINITY_DN16196_c0_g1_i1.p1 TRINITY_DN16196_c0_g1~~TRINITY_DN16196_c0_g1_i1.p1  ORF type:complete len:141 (-),score=39.16 TRINITY_DN16196_c0_g1_i1:15-413(-)
MSDQDWHTIVLHKKETTIKGESALARAKQTGAAVETVAKASSNKPAGLPNAKKIDNVEELDSLAHKQVSREQSLRIQQGRQAKGWTQKELAQKINEKQTVVNEYECQRAIPDTAILAKMEKALGIKLRGKLE